MSRRSQPHLIFSPKGVHQVKARQWNQMLAEGIIERKQLPNGEKSRRMAVISAAALVYHSWIAIERAWLTTNVQAFSNDLNYFRQQELVMLKRQDRINEDVMIWEGRKISESIANCPAPGLLPKDED